MAMPLMMFVFVPCFCSCHPGLGFRHTTGSASHWGREGGRRHKGRVDGEWTSIEQWKVFGGDHGASSSQGLEEAALRKRAGSVRRKFELMAVSVESGITKISGGNHFEERLLDQAQARASYTPLFWGHSRSIPQGMILDVQPLVKSLFCPIRPSPNGFFDSEASTP